jgi:hypothetical protein
MQQSLQQYRVAADDRNVPPTALAPHARCEWHGTGRDLNRPWGIRSDINHIRATMLQQPRTIFDTHTMLK